MVGLVIGGFAVIFLIAIIWATRPNAEEHH